MVEVTDCPNSCRTETAESCTAIIHSQQQASSADLYRDSRSFSWLLALHSFFCDHFPEGFWFSFDKKAKGENDSQLTVAFGQIGVSSCNSLWCWSQTKMTILSCCACSPSYSLNFHDYTESLGMYTLAILLSMYWLTHPITVCLAQ